MYLALDIALLTDPATDYSREHIDALRNQHPSDIAETLEESGCSPSQMVEVLVMVGNHKAIDAFAQLEPENPDMLYYKAVYFTKIQQMDSASHYLALARKNGLKE